MASSSHTDAGENGGHDSVAEFCSLTSCTPDQATFYLEANNNQFDRAVGMFYDQEHRENPEDSEAGTPSDEQEAYATQSFPNSGASAQENPNRPRRRWLSPILVLQRGLQIAFQTVHMTSSAIGIIGAQLLPQRLIRSLQGGLTSISGGPMRLPQTAASSFIQAFEQRYGQIRPQWQDKSWSDSARLSHSQFKLLFVYLHAPYHQDTERFCQECLCDLELSRYVNDTFTCWAGDITTPDAYKLSQSLRVTAYPYTALLAFSGSRIRLIAAAEGALLPSQLLPLLQEAQERQAVNLVAEQADHNEQDVSRRLREEQDEEYLRSLEADRERERQREEAEQQKAEARQAAEKVAAQEREIREQEQKRVADKASTLRNRRNTKASQLGSEAPAGSPNSIHIRVRLPDGRNFQRRFLATDPLQKAYDFVDSLESLDVLKYSLATSYPRRMFSEDLCSSSFEELGLGAQATFFVQSQDD